MLTHMPLIFPPLPSSVGFNLYPFYSFLQITPKLFFALLSLASSLARFPTPTLALASVLR